MLYSGPVLSIFYDMLTIYLATMKFQLICFKMLCKNPKSP